MSLTTVTRLPVPHQEQLPVPDPGYGSSFQPPEEDTFSMRRVFAALRRRKWFVLAIIILLTGIAYFFIRQMTPIYESTVTLAVQANRGSVIGQTDVFATLNQDNEARETEAEKLRSRQMAELVVARLDLLNDDRFNPTLKPPEPSVLDSIISGITGLFDGAEASTDNADTFGEDALATNLGEEGLNEGQLALLTEDEILKLTINNFMMGLTVLPSDRSRTIAVTYASSDRAFAALAANTVADIYISGQVESRESEANAAVELLETKIAEAEQRLRDAEDELAAYIVDNNIVEVENATLLTRDLTTLRQELLFAQQEQQSLQSQYNQLQAGNLDAIPEVQGSGLITALRSQEATAQALVGELSTTLAAGHPDLQAARAQLGNIQGAIGAEIRRIALRMENNLSLANDRAERLQVQVADLEAQLEGQTQSQVELRQLQSQVESARSFYETLLTRFDEVNVVSEEQRDADASILSRAVQADKASYPNTTLFLIAAFAGAAVVGIAFALLAEFLDSGFRSITQIEQVTGAPSLGLVPTIKGSEKPHELVLSKPNSAFGESIRSLRTSLLLTAGDRPVRTVAVTSCVPNEGKTSVALSLAMMAAQAGQKVVILDCDLRKPSVHRELDTDNKAGLSDYLVGNKPLEEVMEIDPRSDLHYITAGSKMPNPPELLQSNAMNKLLQELGANFDFVVLDTPPLMAVSDALLLLRRCDKTIFLARWEKTRRETTAVGVRQAYDSGADLAGVLLTQVDVRKMAHYGYADSGYYYYSSYKKYYAD